MKKIKLFLSFLERLASNGVLVTGYCFVLILSLLSIAKINGTLKSATVNLDSAVSGWYPVLWISLLVIFTVAKVVMFLKQIKIRKSSNDKDEKWIKGKLKEVS